MKHKVELSSETIAHLGRISMGDLRTFPDDVATEICLLMRNLAKDEQGADKIRSEFCTKPIRLVDGDRAELMNKIDRFSEVYHNKPDDHARELYFLMNSDDFRRGKYSAKV